ncbi:MAG: response regulator [Hyphomicrobium sp.]
MRQLHCATEPLRVLVADDDPIFVSLAASALRRAGCDVRIANDGVEAFEALEREPFGLVLVDLSMPRIDGFRLIALIRSTPRLTGLPIVVLSSLTDAEAVKEAYALGANAFQSKPVNWELFPIHLRHVLHCARKLADTQAQLDDLRRQYTRATA